jgi:hypothetical protein
LGTKNRSLSAHYTILEGCKWDAFRAKVIEEKGVKALLSARSSDLDFTLRTTSDNVLRKLANDPRAAAELIRSNYFDLL